MIRDDVQDVLRLYPRIYFACHTRHVPTEQKQYVVMPFEDDNALCYECHL